MSPARTRILASIWLIALLSCLHQPSPATAQPISDQTGGFSTFLNPSIPSTGMGRTGVAAFWLEDRNDWANPALLGYQRGIRYSHGKTQLIPQLSDDVFFTSDRIALGAGGVGISIVGKPSEGLGELLLDYGPVYATDEEGNVIGIYRPTEQIRQIGVGVNVVQLLENLMGTTGGGGSRLSRYADLSLGHTWKTLLIDFSSPFPPAPAIRGETDLRDRGALLRLTPIGALETDGPSRFKLDVSAGYSQRNYGDATIEFPALDDSDPIFEERLVGAATRLSLILRPDRGGIWNVLVPAISVAGTWEEVRYFWDGDRAEGLTKRTGQEVSLLGLISLRHGLIEDPTRTFYGDTWGYSVGLQYQGIVGARYDWSEAPQARYLGSVDHAEGFTVWFDPVRFVNTASEGPFPIR